MTPFVGHHDIQTPLLAPVGLRLSGLEAKMGCVCGCGAAKLGDETLTLDHPHTRGPHSLPRCFVMPRLAGCLGGRVGGGVRTTVPCPMAKKPQAKSTGTWRTR